MKESKSLKFLKNKQKAYFKEFGSHATDDVLLSEWMEEYHDNCVLERTLNEAIFDSAKEEGMLRKLWMDIIDRKMNDEIGGLDLTQFADDVIFGYRRTFMHEEPTEFNNQGGYNEPVGINLDEILGVGARTETLHHDGDDDVDN